jgi:hypothetical protein
MVMTMPLPDHWRKSLECAESMLSEAEMVLEACDVPQFDILLRFHGAELKLKAL